MRTKVVSRGRLGRKAVTPKNRGKGKPKKNPLWKGYTKVHTLNYTKTIKGGW